MIKTGKSSLAVAFAITGVLCATSQSRASSAIADGTFLQPLGSIWHDFTGVGITGHPAPTGIPGNYESMPKGADLYQYFGGPTPGTYSLSFYVQNPSPWPVELAVALQNPGGGIPPAWLELAQVIQIPTSTSFTQIQFPVNVFQSTGTETEITFSNSFDNPHSAGPGFYWPGENSINPPGSVIDVADVLLTPGALGTPGPVPGLLPPSSGISAFLGSGPNFGAFNSNVVGATNGTTNTLWGAATFSTSGGNPPGQVRDDSSTDVYLQPDNDPTNYLFAAGSGTATVTWRHNLNSFTFYWGSIDSYNTLTLSNGNSITGAALGSALGLAFDGNGNSNVSRWITIFDPTPFDSFMASSSQAAFEFDMAAVPEAPTWALMALGFAGLGCIGRFAQRPRVGGRRNRG